MPRARLNKRDFAFLKSLRYMNDKLQTDEIDQPTPIEIDDVDSPDDTKSATRIMKSGNSKGSPGNNSKSNELSSSNNKISSKTFSFTESSIRSKKKNITKTKISDNLQNIKNKDEVNHTDKNQLQNLNETKQRKNDEENQKENSYNTNSTDSEVEVDFSTSDKKIKNDQEFELKLFSAASSSSFTRIKKVRYEVEQIKNFISQETKRLENEEYELSINNRLRSEITFIATAPRCSIRTKLFKMGFL